MTGLRARPVCRGRANGRKLRHDADFDPRDFDHVALYDQDRRRIEMHLRANRPVAVRVAAIDLDVTLRAGETIRTEVSCKYTRNMVTGMLREAGLELDGWFTDEAGRIVLAYRNPHAQGAGLCSWA